MKKKYKIFIILIILFMIYFITIGYSSFSNSNSIENILVNVSPKADARITNITLLNTNNGGISLNENYNINSIFGNINLPNSNSTVTYKVDITVFYSMEMFINSITLLNDNLDYEIINYNLGDILCNTNNECNYGITDEVNITIKYKEGKYDSNNIIQSFKLDFSFESNNHIAKIDNTYFDTLQDAVNNVSSDNIEKRILLLKNSNEIITISKNKNIIIDLQGNTLGNVSNNPVIINNGTLELKNGIITSNAPKNGAINNEASGNIIINNMSILHTGGRQALYNNKGIATITNNSYLKSSTTERAAVQNQSGGTLTIKNGTIISTGFNAINNAGIMSLGIKNDDINYFPMIQGIDNGIYTTTNIKIFDGIIKGVNKAINDENKVDEIESGYNLISDFEEIEGIIYQTKYLGIAHKVTFNPSGGNISEGVRYVLDGKKIGTLPIPIRSGYKFLGWFTDINDGDEINDNTIIESEITFYAHWEKNISVARIGDNIYDSLQEAVNASRNNIETTIILLKDVSESITISSSKNIIFDFSGKTLSNSGNNAVITNNGNIKFIGGTITSNADTATINQNAGNLIISGGNIIATGSRQAIYITGGVTTILNDAYLSSNTTGTPSDSTIERGTIQCLSLGTLKIEGGTIVAKRQQAISNEGNLTIGIKDGIINNLKPLLIGEVYGIKSNKTFNYYDGVIKGKTESISGSINEIEDNSQILNSTETINENIYKTVSLQIIE